jgi:hypothetical protein
VLVQFDRFEDNGWAVMLVGERSFNLPRELLPGDARPGDVFEMSLRPDPEETERRREKSRRIMEELLEDGE